MTPRLGLAFLPTLPPERLVPLARACDGVLDELWVWEDCFKESGVASAVAALAATEHLTVGLSLMPAPLRAVSLCAMEIATTQRLFPGRFVPGVGHGIQDWMEQVGGRVGSPMTLLEDYAVALRRLLAGEEVTMTGRYVTLDRVRLDWPPAQDEQLWLGGSGPRTLELSGRLGDGVLLAGGLDVAAVAAGREAAARGWACREPSVGRGETTMPLLVSLVVATGPDAARLAAEDVEAWGMPAGGPGQVAAGSAEQVAEVIRDHLAAGVTHVVLQPRQAERDVEGLIRFVAEEVRPLLAP